MRGWQRLAAALGAAGVMLLAGCAQAPVARSIELAAAGQEYAATLRRVNELALNESIDHAGLFLSQAALRDEAVLLRTVELLRQRQQRVAAWAEYLQLLADYFARLEELARGDPSGDNTKALKAVLTTLKAADLGLELPDRTRRDLVNLTGLVSRQVHSAVLAERLEQDAEPIARALALTTAVLADQTRWAETRAQAARGRSYELEVLKPYVERGRALGPTWRRAFGAHVRPAAVVKLLQDAQVASVRMEQGWRQVLARGESLDDVRRVLQELRLQADALVYQDAAP